MTTHETVNRLYADIQTLLRKNYGAAGRGIFAMLKSVEGKLPAKLVWELRMIATTRNLVVHECLEPVPRYFEPLCSEAIETMRAVPAAPQKKQTAIGRGSAQKALHQQNSKPQKSNQPKQQVSKRQTSQTKRPGQSSAASAHPAPRHNTSQATVQTHSPAATPAQTSLHTTST
jgi:hypothetical protein